MTTIGRFRKIDKLGRLVIPKDLRDFYHINENTPIEIVATQNGILIKTPDYFVIKKDSGEKAE